MNTDPLFPSMQHSAESLKALHPALRDILDRELRAGNEIREVSSGWPKPMSILIILKHSFRTENAQLPAGVSYNEINDPHYWFAEYCHEETSQIVACPFPR